MKVALFSDSACVRDEVGQVSPIRDRFPHFIAPLANRLDLLTLCSRCEMQVKGTVPLEPLPLSARFHFESLPYYSGAEDFYRRLPLILPTAWRSVARIVTEHDIIFLRVHNALAWLVTSLATRRLRPLVLYWAGLQSLKAQRRTTLENHGANALREPSRVLKWSYIDALVRVRFTIFYR